MSASSRRAVSIRIGTSPFIDSRADGAADGDTVNPGQHHVENQQVERIGLRQPQPRRAVRRGDRRQPFELQVQHDQVADMRIVFDDQDAAPRVWVSACGVEQRSCPPV